MFICYYYFQTPWDQYNQKKTSILTEVSEPEKDYYPSVTVCAGESVKRENTAGPIYDLLKLDSNRTELPPDEVPDLINKYNWNYKKHEIIIGLFQEFIDGHPNCQRGGSSTRNLVHEDPSVWTISIPHPQNSGICFTYNPSHESAPGVCYSIRIAIGNYTDPHSWPQMDRVKVFLHPPGKFVYFAEPDTLPNNYKIDNLKLRKDHENSFTLSKVSNTYLSRTDRECESKSNYNWGYCLDELFMLRKGCQDPWHYNPKIKLPACTNVTEILGSYNQPPAAIGWDGQFWDRQYMAEKEVSAIERDGMMCKSPCDQILYDTEPSYILKAKTPKFEYGVSQEWIYAVRILYKNLLQEKKEEYLVCEFACLLSSVGGYIGLFFGVSIFDLIFTVEWIITYIYAFTKPKK